jgi:hypothetical protein
MICEGPENDITFREAILQYTILLKNYIFKTHDKEGTYKVTWSVTVFVTSILEVEYPRSQYTGFHVTCLQYRRGGDKK